MLERLLQMRAFLFSAAILANVLGIGVWLVYPWHESTQKSEVEGVRRWRISRKWPLVTYAPEPVLPEALYLRHPPQYFPTSEHPTALAQDNEAEKLFRSMEKKIKSAKAFEVIFSYQLQGKTTTGSLLLTDVNQARLRLTGPFHFGVKRNASFELVSDGKRLKTKGAKLVIASNGQAGVDPDGHTEGATPKSFHAALRATFCRGGVGLVVLGLPYAIREEIDPDGEESRMKVYDFKAGAEEKVGERQARVVRYRFGKGGNDDADISVWIDSETGLPLRRTFALPRGDRIRITESYSEIKLDPKVDASAFELP